MNKYNKISNARFVQPADLRSPTTVVKITRIAKQKAEVNPLFIYVKNFLFFFEKKYWHFLKGVLIYNHRERGGNPQRVAHESDIRPPSWEPPCTARSPVGAVYKCEPAPVRLWNTLGGGRQDGAKNFFKETWKKVLTFPKGCVNI